MKTIERPKVKKPEPMHPERVKHLAWLRIADAVVEGLFNGEHGEQAAHLHRVMADGTFVGGMSRAWVRGRIYCVLKHCAQGGSEG